MIKRAISIVALLSAIATPLSAQDVISVERSSGEPFAVNRSVLGVNITLNTKPYYADNKAFMAKIEDVGLQNYRFPGGTVGNYYDFETGLTIGYDNIKEADYKRRVSGPAASIKKNKPNGDGYDTVCNMLLETGVNSTLMLNIIGKSPAENRKLLEDLKARGVEPQFIEIGNEVYFNTYARAIKDVEEYITLGKEYRKIINEIFPKTKIGVVIPSHLYTHFSFLDERDDSVNDRQTVWYQRMQEENFYDAVIIHMYAELGMDKDVKKSDFISFYDSYKYSISHEDDRIYRVMDAIKDDFPKSDVWVTEYHVGGFSGDLRSFRLRYTYIGAMSAANSLLKFVNSPRVTLASWHNMNQWLTYKRPMDGIALADDCEFDEMVNYQMFKIFSEPIAKAKSVVPSKVIGSGTYQGEDKYNGDYPLVESILFSGDKDGGAGYLLLLNKGEKEYKFDMKSLTNSLSTKLKKYSTIAITPNKGAKLDKAILSERDYTLIEESSAAQYVDIKPYSITVIKL